MMRMLRGDGEKDEEAEEMARREQRVIMFDAADITPHAAFLRYAAALRIFVAATIFAAGCYDAAYASGCARHTPRLLPRGLPPSLARYAAMNDVYLRDTPAALLRRLFCRRRLRDDGAYYATLLPPPLLPLPCALMMRYFTPPRRRREILIAALF